MLVKGGVSSSDEWLMIATLSFVYFRANFVMREKSPARSMLDCICGLSYYRVRAAVSRVLSLQ